MLFGPSHARGVILLQNISKMLLFCFRRACIRCGTGLFVTDNLLQSGFSMVTLVSLKYSLAGLAMKQGIPLTVRLPAGSTSFGGTLATRIVACVPAAVPAPPGTAYRPLQVGTILIGSPKELSPGVKSHLAQLASVAGPALLSLGLSQVQHLSELLSLRDADAEYIGAEEDLQDLPWDVVRPQQTPAGPPTQPLDLGSSFLEQQQQQHQQKNDSGGGGGDDDDHAAAAAADTDADFFRKGSDPRLPLSGSSASSSSLKGESGSGVNSVVNNIKRLEPLTEPYHHHHRHHSELAARMRYVSSEAHTHALADATLCACYLIAVMCMMWAAPSTGVQPPAAWAALLTAAGLPFLASIMALIRPQWGSVFYARCREALLALMVVVTVAVNRRGGPLEKFNVTASASAGGGVSSGGGGGGFKMEHSSSSSS